ncbi:MAG: sensor histidine kinase [Silanimonas sp.]
MRISTRTAGSLPTTSAEPGSMSSAASIATDGAGAVDEAHRAWRRLNLVYLIFAFLPLIWQRGDLALGIGATLLAAIVFLPIYWTQYSAEGRRGLYAAVAVAAIGFALTPVNPGGNTFLIYAFATLGFSQRWRVAVIVAVLIAAAYGGWLLLLGLPLPFLLAPVVIGGAVLAGAILGRREMQRSEKLRLTQAEVDRLARVAERERIGRDLHDLLGHTLSVIALKSELARKLAERDGSAAASHIGEVEQVARDALKQVRDAVTGMRSAELANELVNARLAAVGAGLDFDAHVDPLPPLEPAQENALARGLRESLTNVLRHAQASRVKVDISRQGRAVQLEVQDNGRGCTSTPGNGLSGMRERAEALGGQLTIDGAAGAGTRLRLLLPLDGPAVRG